jgi:hypothetical protein
MSDAFIERSGRHDLADLPPDMRLANLPPGGELAEEFGYWSATAGLLRRLGATSVYRMGRGLGATFKKFSIETQVYPTAQVVAMSSGSRFRLSSAVSEKEAFSLFLNHPTDGSDTPRGTFDVGFGPIPDARREIDPLELARRYACALAAVLAKHPSLIDLPPQPNPDVIEHGLLRLLA